MSLLSGQFSTPRLHLRRPVAADADALFAAYCQDPAVCRFMVWAPHESVTVTRDFMATCLAGWRAGTPLTWVLTGGETDAAFGMIEARLQGSTVALGYVLARARWGQGLMAEAISAVTAASLARPDIFRVQAICDVENRGSARALEKAGFSREGRLERYGIHPNISPEPRAVFMYARVR